MPEIAARAHAEIIDALSRPGAGEAGLSLGDGDAIAATAGPGLIGGVMAALMTAKGLCLRARVVSRWSRSTTLKAMPCRRD